MTNSDKGNDTFLGKTVIINLTFLNSLNQVDQRLQLSGTISEINEEGIFITLEEGGDYTLPPDLSAIKVAPAGRYEFETNGKIIENSDYMTSWTIYKSNSND